MDQDLMSPTSTGSAPPTGASAGEAGIAPLPPAGMTLLQRLFSAYPGSMGLRLGHWSARLGRHAQQPPRIHAGAQRADGAAPAAAGA